MECNNCSNHSGHVNYEHLIVGFDVRRPHKRLEGHVWQRVEHVLGYGGRGGGEWQVLNMSWVMGGGGGNGKC